ncbi:hypothetical protein [Acinetobacter sp. ANC 4910]|uniref:hypothetical protein n=1 Tax=Acinetobacter sp. ANC 4910 TaxID=2529850 RepID=UPI0013F1602A|nr:hypothetical protein [Acinetobacter sp. ANC 4910]
MSMFNLRPLNLVTLGWFSNATFAESSLENFSMPQRSTIVVPAAGFKQDIKMR